MSQTTEKTQSPPNEDGNALEELERLRDDLRVRIHLGGMELRDAFTKLEHEADRLLSAKAPATAHALHDLVVRLRRLAHQLERLG